MSKTNGILAALAEILLKAVGSGRASRSEFEMGHGHANALVAYALAKPAKA